jgi:hypothetical protein
MQTVAFSFLAIFSLPFVFLVWKLIHRCFFALPPMPRGIRLIRAGRKWTFQDGPYVSQFTYWTQQGAAMAAIGYRLNLSRL